MKKNIKLLITDQNDENFIVFLAAKNFQKTVYTSLPEKLVKTYLAWRDRYVSYNNSPQVDLPKHVLSHYSDQLTLQMRNWLEKQEWSPLEKLLKENPYTPLQIQIDSSNSIINALPWECIDLERPIFREVQAESFSYPKKLSRIPRFLLIVGDENSLDLSSEIDQLQSLHFKGHICLKVLRGIQCTFKNIRSLLQLEEGWDALFFLGHSESDPSSGGRIHLGDGSWLASQSVEDDFKKAAKNGLSLVVLNSCNGIDWAKKVVSCGVSWSICFREVVTSKSAAFVFQELIYSLESGFDICNSLVRVRYKLIQQTDQDSAILLTGVVNSSANTLKLPLSKYRQLKISLYKSTSYQFIVIIIFLFIGITNDLVPWNPVNHLLLNQRLRLQKHYRSTTNQIGPKGKIIPFLLLERRRSYPALNVIPTPGQFYVPREALLKILTLSKPENISRIGFDIVLDDPGIEPKTTKLLANLIKNQGRLELFAGYFGANSDGYQAGEFSKPISILSKAGLDTYNLSVNTDPGSRKSFDRRQAPLQLKAPINKNYFSHALAGHPETILPADAIIDWSLDWTQYLHRIMPKDLTSIQGPVLLIGTDGNNDPLHPDLFDPPYAILDSLEKWNLSRGDLPGVVVQGVLSQSMKLEHWITPVSNFVSIAITSILGLFIAALNLISLKRFLILSFLSIFITLISFQITIAKLFLIPLFFPIISLWIITLIRRNEK